MKLSEAMRLGAMALPPIKGPYFECDYRGRTCGACALGAALYAEIGERVTDRAVRLDMRHEFHSRWPELGDAVSPPDEVMPVSDDLLKHNPTLADWIIVLFERFNWTRERVADWVATVEQAQEAPTTKPVAVEAR